MKSKLKKIWLEALRSGKYEQAQGVLKSRDGKFCCLGVLCEVAQVESKVDEGQGYVYLFEENGETDLCWDFPNKGFMEAVGIDAPTARKLAQFNDDGLTFEDIADYIEKEL